jgi:hypothetical protein
MSKTNGSDLAFARPAFYNSEFVVSQPEDGCTKREHFAAMAMQGLLARANERYFTETNLGILESKRIAEESGIMADELIKALNETK